MIWDDDWDDIYENEYGKCAYIAGAIRVHTDSLDMALYYANVHYEAVCSDVFCIKDGDADMIKRLLKERLKAKQTLETEESDKIDAEVDALEIVESYMSMQDAIYQFYKDRQDVNLTAIREAIEKYDTDVTYYLKKAKKVYVVNGETVKMDGKISNNYLGILFNIVFVEYENHLLMFLHGSCE